MDRSTGTKTCRHWPQVAEAGAEAGVGARQFQNPPWPPECTFQETPGATPTGFHSQALFPERALLSSQTGRSGTHISGDRSHLINTACFLKHFLCVWGTGRWIDWDNFLFIWKAPKNLHSSHLVCFFLHFLLCWTRWDFGVISHCKFYSYINAWSAGFHV